MYIYYHYMTSAFGAPSPILLLRVWSQRLRVVSSFRQIAKVRSSRKPSGRHPRNASRALEDTYIHTYAQVKGWQIRSSIGSYKQLLANINNTGRSSYTWNIGNAICICVSIAKEVFHVRIYRWLLTKILYKYSGGCLVNKWHTLMINRILNFTN